MESAPNRSAERSACVNRRPCGLMHGEVHVWFASLRVPTDALDVLRRSLSSGERARAKRFRMPSDRAAYLAAHGIAREILSRYAGMEPHELRFERDRSGKPVLDEASGGASLAFSMSHSGSAALFAVAGDRSVGADIERIDPRMIDERVSERILSPAERAALGALPPAARTDALFRFWTLKEAFLKALGDGLAIPPATIDVCTASTALSMMRAIEARVESGIPWTLVSLPAPPGYAAAAACRGGGCRITCRMLGDRIAESAAPGSAA